MPEVGQNRITAMTQSRSDWCISRQVCALACVTYGNAPTGAVCARCSSRAELLKALHASSSALSPSAPSPNAPSPNARSPDAPRSSDAPRSPTCPRRNAPRANAPTCASRASAHGACPSPSSTTATRTRSCSMKRPSRTPRSSSPRRAPMPGARRTVCDVCCVRHALLGGRR